MSALQSPSNVIGILLALSAMWVGSASLCGQDSPRKEGAAKRGYTISKETTYFTGPLKPDGRIDFVAAINEHFGEGVTESNNAARIIIPLVDSSAWSVAEDRARVFASLGLSLEDFAEQPTLVEYRTYVDSLSLNLDQWNEAYIAALERPWTDDEFPELKNWLDANREPLARVSEASRRDHFHVPLIVPSGEPSLAAIRLDHIQHMRGIARMFAARAHNHIAHQRWNEAWADVLTMTKLGRLVGQGPTMVENLVGLAITGMSCASANEFIAAAGPAAVDWEQLRGDWETGPITDLGRSLGITERAMFIQLACSVLETESVNGALQQIMTGDPDSPRLDTQLVSRTLRGMLTGGEAKLDDALRFANQAYDQTVAVLQVPDAASREAAMDEMEKRIQVVITDPEEGTVATLVRAFSAPPEEPAEQFSKVLLSLVFPSARLVSRAEYRHQASLNQVDLALAARQLQSQTGHLPRSLRELEPLVDEATMNQPSVDEPIVLRPDGDGIVIYHWCSNRSDDGGAINAESGKDFGVRLK
jgi:hypothetical protein